MAAVPETLMIAVSPGLESGCREGRGGFNLRHVPRVHPKDTDATREKAQP